jgi:hypothetical protein
MSTYTVEWLSDCWLVRTSGGFLVCTPADLKCGRVHLPLQVRRACRVARKTNTRQIVGESTEK